MKKSVIPTIALLALLGYSAQAAVSIPTQKGDNGRSGLTPLETTLTLQNVNVNNFGQLFQRSTVSEACHGRHVSAAIDRQRVEHW